MFLNLQLVEVRFVLEGFHIGSKWPKNQTKINNTLSSVVTRRCWVRLLSDMMSSCYCLVTLGILFFRCFCNVWKGWRRNWLLWKMVDSWRSNLRKFQCRNFELSELQGRFCPSFMQKFGFHFQQSTFVRSSSLQWQSIFLFARL